MLLSGILIARFLGKDLYGEYGIVKSTMYLMALFATFALGDTSTKLIAEYIQKDRAKIYGIVKSAYRIVLAFSCFMCLLLVAGAEELAAYVKVPEMSVAFRFLGIIIIFRAINTVGSGILGGFKDYRRIGINSIVSGLAMLSLSIPLTYTFSLDGALVSLLVSQILFSVLNTIFVRKKLKGYTVDANYSTKYDKRLIFFSLPLALNEFIYSFSSWGISLLITRYSSVGELGIYSACNQWFSIILFIPGLLGNVILSYLSTTAGNNTKLHRHILYRMLLVNFVCTFIPMIVVLLFSNVITNFYGPTFATMKPVLLVTILSTVFACMSRVFSSNLTSEGRNWRSFVIRSSTNFLTLVAIYVVMRLTCGSHAAFNSALVVMAMTALTFVWYFIDFKWHNYKTGQA